MLLCRRDLALPSPSPLILTDARGQIEMDQMVASENACNADGKLSLDEILAKFREDLQKRGKLTAEEAAEDDRLLLGLRILDTYIRCPLPEDRLAIPVNYCAAQKYVPAWFDPLFTALRC